MTFSPVLSDYATRRYPLIRYLEEPGGAVHLPVYIDSNGFATIGAGFKISSNAAAILQGMGYSLSTASIQTIANAVSGTYSRDATGVSAAQTDLNNALRTATGDNSKLFVFADTTQVENTFNSIVTHYEDLVTAWSPIGVIPESRERLALLSLAYNNLIGPGKSPSLRQALLDGNRAEAWYEIRYNTNGDELPGIAKRRYQESELFGLYDNPAGTTGTDEAFSIYRMYARHRDDIFDYEATYGEQPNGAVGSRGNMINQAHNDYPPSIGPAVQTLRTELTIAAIALEGHYIVDEGIGLPGTIDPLNIQVTSANLTTLNGEDGTSHTGSNRDLLIGTENQADTLNGNGGDDFLFGNGGNDILNGGSGDDHLNGGLGIDTLDGGSGDDALHGDDESGGDLLIGGTGNDIYYADEGDTIRDSDGKGTVYLNGKQLTFATRQQGDSVWRDSAGNTYTLTNGVLQVGDPLTIEGFANGELGIYLDDEEDPNNPLPAPVYNPNNASRLARRIDPLVLDLDSNGHIDAVGSTESTVYFDFNGDTIAEKSGWIAPQDGLLALDANDNGVIDDLAELFGTAEIDGFTELASHDGNGDGRIDAADTDFVRLRVWQDVNQDGISQAGELKTLDELSITQINLAATPADIALADNLVTATGSFVRDGQERLVADVHLAVNFALTDSNPNRPLDLPPTLDGDVFDLPWLRGYGLVKSLPVAYQENPNLKQAAQDLMAQDYESIVQNFQGFVTQWTGLDAAHAAHGVTRIHVTNEDKAWMLETLTGQNVNKSAIEAANFGAITPGANRFWNSAYIDSQWQTFLRREASAFAIQATAGAWIEGTYYSLGTDRFVVADAAKLMESLTQGLLTIDNRQDAIVAAAALDRLRVDGCDLQAGTLKAALAASPYSPIYGAAIDGRFAYLGYAGTLNAADARDWWLAGSGNNDTLTGNTGNDVLYGGGGNDNLSGGAGDDIYLFGIGSGQDTIIDSDTTTGNIDRIEMAVGVQPSGVVVTRNYSDLYLSINGGADRLTLSNWFTADGYKVERVAFADGTVWDATYLDAVANSTTEGNDFLVGLGNDDTIRGFGGNDTLYGQGGNDVLDGGSGNDVLYGEAGNDVLDGGAGYDNLLGGIGNDAYLFGNGSGQDYVSDSDAAVGNIDTIQMAAGMLPGHVDVSRDANHLYLSLNGGTDRLTLLNWFTGSQYRIEQVTFEDATVWDVVQLTTLANTTSEGNNFSEGTSGDDSIDGLGGNDTLYGNVGNDELDGGAGNDYLDGGAGNDTLIGLGGNDTLYGYAGNDSYVFGNGSGQDVIYDYDATVGNIDTVQMAMGVSPDNVIVTRDASNLYLSLNNGADRLILQNWFSGNAYKIEQVVFDDATVWNVAMLNAMVSAPTENADYLEGISTGDVIDGLGGNDQLRGYGGNDTLSGGAGGDALYGQDGDDILDGGVGGDILDGEAGNDTLDGGAGNDSLQGGVGNDSYVFGNGSGRDTIHDYDFAAGNLDTVQMEAGVIPGDVMVTRDSSNLYLSLNDGADRLTLSFWFYTSNGFKVERVTFADGTVWDATQLDALANASSEANDSLFGADGDDTLSGLGGSDTLYGYAGNDVLDGGMGNDTLDGEMGNDTLSGGAGNDSLQGGVGNDSYVFGNGSGQDTIYDYDLTAGNLDTVQIAAGVLPGNVAVTRDSSNLYLSLNGGADRLTLSLWFHSSNVFKVERVTFADGTIWDATDLLSRIPGATNGDDALYGLSGNDTLNGLGGNDTLYGESGNDVMDGGVGNDSLQGGVGNDSYVFGIGYGQDIIYDYDYSVGNLDTVQMAAGVLPGDVTVTRDYSNLYLSLNDGADRLTLKNWFSSDSYKVEQVAFADGTVWNSTDLLARIPGATNGNDLIVGTSSNDTINGLGGNDSLYGQEGNDTLVGGAGSDTLYGNTGNDALDGGASNDYLSGDTGNDSYIFGSGSGQDVIQDYDTTAGNLDTVQMAAGLLPGDVTVTRDQSSLYLSLNGGADRLTLQNWFNSDSYKVEQVTFADGTVWNSADFLSRIPGVTNGNDFIVGTSGNDTLNGLEGNDFLYGQGGNDVLDGDTGDDSLYGQEGADILDGGSGNDYLAGEAGNDSYVFGSGSGQDIIQDYDATAGNLDTVQMAVGVLPGDVTVTRDQSSLYLSLNGGADRLTLSNWFSSDSYKVEQVTFADGTVWSSADLLARIPGATNGNDFIVGTSGADTLNGLGGNDTLYGESGNDTLDGSTGNDYLSGGVGNDSYVFGNGSGQDVINDYDATVGNVDTVQMAAGVLPGDVTVTRNQSSLYLSLNGGADRLTLSNWFGGDGYKIERVSFADGTVWNSTDLLSRIPGATNGNDSLFGTNGDDTLDGLGGNDTLYGQTGNDSYIFGNGSGQDTISDYDTTAGNLDTVQMAVGVLPGDVTVTRDQSSLYLSLNGGADRLTLSNWFSSDSYKVEQVTFADGTIWNSADLLARIPGATNGNDFIVGTSSNDTINGLGGNDSLYGQGGNDVLDGDTGDDSLNGQEGADILDGGSGNDYLSGGVGNDSYVFGNGSGQDTISDYDATAGNLDTVQMAAGLLPGDVTVTRDQSSLYLSLNGGADRLTLQNWFNSDSYKVEQVTFADGTVWNSADLLARIPGATNGNDSLFGTNDTDTLNGLGGDDLLYGQAGNDSLVGGAGIDTLDGGTGNDILDGGADNDYLYGAEGGDTYIFSHGYGHDYVFDYGYDSTVGNIDTVQMAEGVLPSDVTVTRDLYNLYLSLNNGADRLTLSYWLSSDFHKVEQVAFADGTLWDSAQLLNLVSVATEYDNTLYGSTDNDSINGLGGNDELYGQGGNDSLDGGAGADFLDGGIGNDSYVFGSGSGQDVIQDYDTTAGNLDMVQMTSGVLPGDVTVTRDYYNLYLSLNGGADRLTLQTWFNSDSYKVERVTFADGTVWNSADLLARIPGATNGNDLLFGTSGNDTLNGLNGNDTLDGGIGNDTYLFGNGSGQDVVSEYDSTVGNVDTVEMTTDVLTDDVTVTRDGSHLYLSLNDGIDFLTLRDWFGSDEYKVEQVVFADGTVWDAAMMEQLAVVPPIVGTEDADVLFGDDSLDDAISGLGGDDQIYGEGGNDILDGGVGDDYLDGGAGNDIYLFGNGSGQDYISDYDGTVGNVDTIQVAADVQAGDVTVTRDYSDLYLSLNGGTDRLALSNWFFDDDSKIEQVVFADGVIWNVSQLNALANAPTSGDDLLYGTDSDDLISGLDGNDEINGFEGNDVLSGGSGSDNIYAGNGNNTLDGGEGDDYISVGSGNNIILGGLGSDSIFTGNGSNTVDGGGDDDGIFDGQGDGVLLGGMGSDQIFAGAGDDILDGGIGSDLLIGGAGNDIFIVENIDDYISEAPDEGIDLIQSSVTYTLGANVENLTLFGTGSTNATGNEIGNVITGNAGNNTLNGDLGVDTMAGGLGNDIYVIDDIDDLAIESVDEGTDTIQSNVDYTLTENVEKLTLTGTESLSGTGNDLNNTLTGNSGDNVLDGGIGTDTLVGGTGNDTYIVDSTGDIVTESASAGTDLVVSSVTRTLGSNFENLVLSGTSDINGTGNTLANFLTGNGANNTLNGGAGADTMMGGLGDDAYVVDNVGDVVTESLSEGTDTIQSSVTYTASANVENLNLTGTSAIAATGNASNNILTGNSGNNTLNGGTGADSLVGGLGNDTYVVDDVGDTTTENTGEGTDLVQAGVTYALAANIENLTLTGSAAINGTGNTLNNTLTGNTADNVLDGGTGTDTMIGGTGNDTYVVDATTDIVTEAASAGTDTIQSSVTFTASANVETLTLIGPSAINGTGNSLANLLTGNIANNTLSGGTGTDTMIGGLGDDLYVVDNAGDVVMEILDEGIDRIQSSVTYTLAANVENLTLTGSTAINATGNALDNILTGNTGTNTLTGGAGNDTYVIQNTTDVVTEAVSGGADTIQSSVTYTASANVENLILTGTSAINGTGNSLSNTLTGNSANNTLNGGGGADTLTGGVGNDTYVVDDAGDLVVENEAEGADLVQSSITYALASNIENLTLTGSTAISATGNALDNILTGNTGANTLTGGVGNDTYVIQNTTDVVIEVAGEGIDTIQSSVTYTASANVENLTLTGVTSYNATGNSLDNILTGNSGWNVLTGGLGNDTYVVQNTQDTVNESVNAGVDTIKSSVTYTASTNVENLTLTGTSAINGTGNSLANVLSGNSAANTLTGGAGNDTYMFGLGGGADIVVENDSTAGNTDLAQFASGTATDQLWFRHVGNDLEVSIIGSGDKMTIQNWYTGSANHVEQFKTADNKLLIDTNVENLVQAMAAFSPPGAGETTLPPAYQTALAPTIAANWQ